MIPGYQVGLDMSLNGGSTTFRNFPDVSMDAFFTAFVNNAQNNQVGTSEATPMWAGFMALINQQAALNGVGRVGFANPVLYAIGLTANQPQPNLYSQSFNDVADGGNNGAFTAVNGYDLVTGWGTPTCGLINQLGSPAPLNPQSFTLVQVHVNSGDDGIRDNSIASLTVNLTGGGTFINVFHPQNTTGWDPKGTVHDLLLPLLAPVAPTAFNSISFDLTQTSCTGCTSDNWTIGGLDVRLANPTGPEACVFHGEATQLGRLTQSNPIATFTPAGCPTAQLFVPPPASPVTEVIFIIGTGDDDLRQGSELDVEFFKPSATTAFDHGVLKASGAPKFDNNTQHTEIFTLAAPHPLSDFGSMVLTMNNSGNDEWHIYGMNVVADSPSGPQTCLYDNQGQPLQVLKSSARSMTLTPSNGCP